MTTQLKPGDMVVGPCQPVGNLPPKQLASVGGRLVEIPGTGVTATGKLFLASRKTAIVANFAAQGLTICDDAAHRFAKLGTCLRLNLGPAGGAIYVWGTNGDFSAFVALRYKFDGTPDGAFGMAGRVTLPAGTLGGTGTASAWACCGQPDGKLLATGYTDETTRFVLRYQVDGVLDGSFGVGGVVMLAPVGPSIVSGGAAGANVRPGDPNQIFHEDFEDDGNSHLIVRDGTGGLLSDRPAGTDGELPSGYRLFGTVLLAEGGFAAPVYNDPGPGSCEVVIYGPDRAIVQKFFAAGYDSNPVFGVNQVVAPQGDGKFLLVGASPGGLSLLVRRYTIIGDLTAEASVPLDMTPFGVLLAVGVGSSGQAMIVTTNNATGTMTLCRINADLSVDTTFGTSGYVISSFAPSDFLTGNAGNFGLSIAIS